MAVVVELTAEPAGAGVGPVAGLGRVSGAGGGEDDGRGRQERRDGKQVLAQSRVGLGVEHG